MDRFGISVGVSPREPLERVGELAAAVEERVFEAIRVTGFSAVPGAGEEPSKLGDIREA